MKVLVIGGGGREHAIVWKLSQSRLIKKIYCAPGNGGTAALAENVAIGSEDFDRLLKFALENEIDLTVVGPEAPLDLGIVDLFEKNGLRIFGPRKDAAILESSKAFSKAFMEKHGIPTARYKVYTDVNKAKADIDSFGYPLVIKADGLAAGKGVIIIQNRTQAVAAIESMMESRKFGSAGAKIVLEEFLEGHEATVLAFVDGKTIVPMVSSQDYKRAMDGDMGLNTGGMGAVCPALHYTEEMAQKAEAQIFQRTLDALSAEGIDYKGILYFGLMLTADGPKVIEYNVRFGDPETEMVLPRLETDLVEIINAVIDGKLDSIELKWKQECTVGVVMASGGYPEAYQSGYEISGLDNTMNEVIIFHAGTKMLDNKIVTAGGRVLVVSALGKDINEAREKAYRQLEKISFKDAHYRKDIAKL